MGFTNDPFNLQLLSLVFYNIIPVYLVCTGSSVGGMELDNLHLRMIQDPIDVLLIFMP